MLVVIGNKTYGIGYLQYEVSAGSLPPILELYQLTSCHDRVVVFFMVNDVVVIVRS